MSAAIAYVLSPRFRLHPRLTATSAANGHW